MSGGSLGGSGLYLYESDDTNTYRVTMLDYMALAGGFTATGSGEGANYIRGHQMRHIYGKASDGQRKKIPIASASDAHFVTGGSITVDGKAFVIQGKIGEKRPSR